MINFLFIQPKGFPDPPFDQIAIDGTLKILCRHRDQNLVTVVVSGGQVMDPERLQIKRGTNFKKFLDLFFAS